MFKILIKLVLIIILILIIFKIIVDCLIINIVGIIYSIIKNLVLCFTVRKSYKSNIIFIVLIQVLDVFSNRELILEIIVSYIIESLN